MNATIIDIRSWQTAGPSPRFARNGRAAIGPATAAGPFSAIEDGALAFDAAPGLVVRVHQGSLWVPHPEDTCSVCVCAGERFVVGRSGRFTTYASRGTQISLEWPDREPAPSRAERNLEPNGTVFRAAAS